MRLLHHTALASLFATFGRIIYTSKVPSPSVLMPCAYCMLQSQAKYKVDSCKDKEKQPPYLPLNKAVGWLLFAKKIEGAMPLEASSVLKQS